MIRSAALIFILFTVGVALANANAIRLRCDARTGVYHKYNIHSAVEMLEASEEEGDIRSKDNSTYIQSTVNLGCDDELVTWKDENGRQHHGQMWKIELTEIATQLNCPSRQAGWEGDACTSNYKDTTRWGEGQNMAYYVVDTDDGRIFWDPKKNNVDTASCQAMRSTLVQLQNALRGDPPENDNVQTGSNRPRKRVVQHSSFSEGTIQKSNRFEHVYRPTQVFQIPGMTAGGVSTINLAQSTVRGTSGFRSHASRAILSKNLQQIDSDAAACPVSQQYLNAVLRSQYGCDEKLNNALEKVMSAEYAKSVSTGDDHRLVSLCLMNEDREDRKHEIFNWLMHQDGAKTTTMGIEILRRIGTEKSQSVLADIIVDHIIEKPWLSNVALLQITELDAVSEHLLSTVERLTSTMSIYNNKAVTGNAWLALASWEHARLSNKNVIPRSTTILQDMSALRTLSLPLLIDVLNNAGSAIPVSELKRIVFDQSISMELRVRAASAVRRMTPSDVHANNFVHHVVTDASLAVPIRMAALKGQNARDKTAQFLHTIMNDPMQPRAVRIQAKKMLVPSKSAAVGCDPYAPSSLDVTSQHYKHNITTGRCHASLGGEMFGASGSIFAFGGLTYNGCDGGDARSFAYSLLGEANLEAHAFSEKFVLLDFDLKETGESTSSDYEDYLRLIITNQVWYDGAIFPEHCYKVNEEVFRTGLKHLFGTTVHFVVAGVPITIQVELQGGMLIRVEGEVCPVQLSASAGVEPMATMDISGSLGAGVKGINAGISLGGDVTMGLLPSTNVTAAECPHMLLCSKLESVVESPVVKVLGYVRFLRKKWTKKLYTFSKDRVVKTPLFDQCVRL